MIYRVEMPDQGCEGLVRIRAGREAGWVEIRGENWWRCPNGLVNPVAAFVDGLLPSHACVLFGTVGAGEGTLDILPHHADWEFVEACWREGSC